MVDDEHIESPTARLDRGVDEGGWCAWRGEIGLQAEVLARS